MRAIPIGIQSFRRIREEGRYYVDKTPLIDYILEDGAEVFQFIRPRRFGKSTNLSMIDAYLNLRYAGNGWFDGLMISDIRPDDPEKNSYPVIRLDMKRVAVSSYSLFLEKMRGMVADVCKQFPELGTSDLQDPDNIELFRQFKSQNGTLGNLSDSLLILSRMLKRQYGRDVVILVDEYDNLLNTSYGSPEQRSILEYLRDFLSSALKGNDSLRLGVVTGVMQIAKESIFSGLNNLEVNNIFSKDVDEMFGFTPKEVERMCADFGHPERFAEAREWYDGYRFGNADIYSPWSILKYINSGFKPSSYWAGTSGNDIIDDLLAIPDQETYANIISLASGKSIQSDVEPGVTFADISDLGRAYTASWCSPGISPRSMTRGWEGTCSASPTVRCTACSRTPSSGGSGSTACPVPCAGSPGRFSTTMRNAWDCTSRTSSSTSSAGGCWTTSTRTRLSSPVS